MVSDVTVEAAMFEARLGALLDDQVKHCDLTHAERATYRLTILGYSPQNAADELGISLLTQRKHSASAARKLGYSSLLEAALHFALELADAPISVRRRTRSGTIRRP